MDLPGSLLQRTQTREGVRDVVTLPNGTVQFMLPNVIKELSDKPEDDLNPGDHIYCHRIGGYSHHGIYINRQRVIHVSGPVEGGKSKSTATVRAVTLDQFLNGDKLKVVDYNSNWWIYFCERFGSSKTTSCLSPTDVIANAEYYLKHPEEYGEYSISTKIYIYTILPVITGGQVIFISRRKL